MRRAGARVAFRDRSGRQASRPPSGASYMDGAILAAELRRGRATSVETTRAAILPRPFHPSKGHIRHLICNDWRLS